jgi:hypothetical protein
MELALALEKLVNEKLHNLHTVSCSFVPIYSEIIVRKRSVCATPPNESLNDWSKLVHASHNIFLNVDPKFNR